MPGSVRGEFDLDARPASSALRSLREEGTATDAVMARLGSTMDRIGTVRQREQVSAYSSKISGLRGELEGTLVVAEGLQERLDALGRGTTTINVGVRGFDEAVGQIAFLEERLAALDRQRAIATVGVRGSARAVTQAGATRAAVSTVGGGGGGFRGLPSIPSLAGRFPFGGIPGAVGILGGGVPLIGGAGALLGSAGAGALGAGATGAAGFGALGTALGITASVAIPAAKSITTAHTALLNFQKQVEEFGSSSTQAKTALSALNATLAAAPGGTGQLLSTEQRFVRRFQSATAPAQSDFMGILTRLLGTGTQLTPLLGTQTNRFFGAASNQTDAFGNFLTSGRSRQTIRSLGGSATGNLDELRRTTDHVFRTLGNIMIAARPFFHEAMVWLDDWTGGWARGTHDIGATRDEIGKMVDQFKTWARLFGAAARLSGDVLGAGAGPGQSMVADLTNTLDRWDKFVNQNPGKVRGFFRDSVDSTERIAGALGHIVDLLFRLGRLLTPIVTEFANLAGIAASLGPGGIPLLLAGYGGLRGGIGRALGAGGAAGGIGTAEGGIIAGTAAGAAGSRLGGIASRFRTPLGLPAGTSPGTLASGSEGVMLSRSAPLMSRAGLAGVLRGGGSLAGGAAMSAGRVFLPVAGAMAALQGLSFPGNVAGKIQAGASSLTLGAVPMPKTAAEKAAREAKTLMPAGGLPTTGGGTGTFIDPVFGFSAHPTAQAQTYKATIVQLQHLQAQAPKTAGGFHQIEQATNDALAAGRKFGLDPTIVKQLRSIRDNARTARASLQEQQGARAFADVQKAFGIRTQGGESLAQSFSKMSGDIEDRANRLHGKSATTFGRMTVGWLEDFKKAHKGMRDEANASIQDVLKAMNRGADKWKIINGHVVDITQTSWASIRKAMASNAQQAQQEVSKAFTTLQEEVIAKLQAMGVPASVARSVTRQQESFQSAGKKSQTAMATGGGVYGKTGGGKAFGGRLAGGGRIPKHPIYGMNDAVPLPDGSFGAGDELIVNRHTERRVNGILSAFGTNLDREVAAEQRPHGGPFGGPGYLGVMDGHPIRKFARGGRGGNAMPTKGATRTGRGTGNSGFVYPMPGFSWSRTDQGVDFYGGTDILAIGSGQVIRTGAPGWPGGGGVLYRLDAGAPSAVSPSSNIIFVYEQITPTVRSGEHVRAGETIARQNPGGSLETGFATASGSPLTPYSGAADGTPMPAGKAMAKWLHMLQGGAGGASATRGAGAVGRGAAPPQISLKNPMAGGSGLLGAGTRAAGGMLAAGMQKAVNKKLAKHSGVGSRGAGAANVGNLPASLQKYNKRWAPHWAPDYGGPTMPVSKIAELAEWAGMPGITMAQIAHGESGYRPGSAGVDPGGTKGYGLWAITSPFHPEVSQYGGYEAMWNPILNAQVAAGEYRSSGLRGWYGTRYLTSPNAHYRGPMNARGGRLSAAHGADFWVNRPTDLRVGDGGVPEHITATPINARGARGRLGQGGPTINLGGVHLHGTSGKPADVKKLAKEAGKTVAEEIAKALGTAAVDDGVLG